MGHASLDCDGPAGLVPEAVPAEGLFMLRVVVWARNPGAGSRYWHGC